MHVTNEEPWPALEDDMDDLLHKESDFELRFAEAGFTSILF